MWSDLFFGILRVREVKVYFILLINLWNFGFCEDGIDWVWVMRCIFDWGLKGSFDGGLVDLVWMWLMKNWGYNKRE